MRRSRYFGVALIGLLVVAAISVAAGSGRKPAKEPQGSVSLRRISVGEVVAIFNQFPEMLPGRYAAQRSDTGFIKDNFPFSEVTSAALKLAFPGARFYKGLDGKMPPRPYLMAIAGNNRYMMPGGFNRLLLASGQAVTDKSILELAEAFVYVAVGSEPIFVRPDMPLGLDTFPPVVFLEAKQTRQVINTVPYSAVLKVRIGAQTEEWYFAPLRGQLDVINRRNAEGLIKEYTPVAVEALPGHGQLYPTPNMVIDTFPTNGEFRGHNKRFLTPDRQPMD